MVKHGLFWSWTSKWQKTTKRDLGTTLDLYYSLKSLKKYQYYLKNDKKYDSHKHNLFAKAMLSKSVQHERAFWVGSKLSSNKIKKKKNTQKKDSRTSLELFFAANGWKKKKTPNYWTMTKFWAVKKPSFFKRYSRKQKDLDCHHSNDTKMVKNYPSWAVL